METSLRILIADGQYLTRLGIAQAVQSLSASCRISELEVSDDLWAALKSNPPDLLILDPDWMDFSLTSDLKRVLEQSPALRVLLISEKFEPDQLRHAWSMGVQSILLKDSTEQEFRQGIQACIDDQRFLATDLVDMVMRKDTGKKSNFSSHPLTPSELEIVRLIGQGLTTKEIAAQRHLSFHTVITHRRNIFKKLEINNSSELLMYAVRNGIIPTIDYSI